MNNEESRRKKISETLKKRYRDGSRKSWNKGKKISEDVKQKISQSMKGNIPKNIEILKSKAVKFKKGQKSWNKDIPLNQQLTEKQLKQRKVKISETLKFSYRTGKRKSWNKGKSHSSKHKEKIRLGLIKYREKVHGGCFPNIGKNEKYILDELESILGYKIQRQYLVCGYFLDGYITELNLAIEVDEKFHDEQKEKDMVRQNEIQEELSCDFVRIKDE